MLLTIDVGNTNITMGVFREDILQGMFRMTTKRPRTSDEYGMTICGILEHRSIDPKKIKDVIIASVVPDIMHSLTSGIIKYLQTTPLIVSAESDTGIRVNNTRSSVTGPDRIVNAVAGYAIAKGPAVVIDFGTATTYDLIGPDSTLEACIIAPGIETAGALPLGRGGYAACHPDPEAGLCACTGHCLGDAGRPRIRSHRPDGIYCAKDERGVRIYGRVCDRYRRSGKDHRQRDGVH